MANEVLDDGFDAARLAKLARTREFSSRLARSETPPGGSDDAPPKRKPATPPPEKDDRDERIAAAKRDVEERRERLRAQTAELKAEKERTQRLLQEYTEFKRSSPAERIRKLTGHGIRELFQDSIAEDREPDKFERRKLAHKVEELRAQVERVEREDMTRAAWARLSAEVADYQGKSDVLRSLNGRQLVELTAGILNENPHASPRDALAFIEQRLSAAKPKPSPQPATPTKTVTAPTKKSKAPPLSETQAFVARFRKHIKKGK